MIPQGIALVDEIITNNWIGLIGGVDIEKIETVQIRFVG